MLDFKEMRDDGVEFEQLIRELLLAEGLDVHWTGVGPDGDKDLIAIESYEGILGSIKRKWVVQCKHNAHSGKSVSKDDLNIMETCLAVDADGYLLACSTQPTSALIRHFKEIQDNKGLETRYWDSIEIEKRLMKPNNFHLINVFFENSSKKIGWKLFNTQDTKFWMAYFKKYFIYLSSRDSLTFSELKFVEKIIEITEAFNGIDRKELIGIERWTNNIEYLVPRAVHYDDKNTNFTVFLDYMFYSGEKPKARAVDFNEYFNQDNWNVDGACVKWDIRFVEANFASDHFRINHKDYYKMYMDNFKTGYERDCSITDFMYDDYDFIEKTIIDYEFQDFIESADYTYSFDKMESDIIACLKEKEGGSALIETVLNFCRKNNDFDSSDGRLLNTWQIVYLNSIMKLREKGILSSKYGSPKGVVTLSEKGRNMCNYYDTILRKGKR
ncbi:restriction endonuclease [Petroclostridium sp. X23]|uniref:restriction endonuclease n=1 Tax=Petroclostridium sp. X23 TaxID=3045146 RepID=UPI0024ACF00C|nr:restriction endonuclease [Petroclostridium sp. X23]WHH58832.1 restriction endonuclease [Petroclostridium sp. X23]